MTGNTTRRHLGLTLNQKRRRNLDIGRALVKGERVQAIAYRHGITGRRVYHLWDELLREMPRTDALSAMLATGEHRPVRLPAAAAFWSAALDSLQSKWRLWGDAHAD